MKKLLLFAYIFLSGIALDAQSFESFLNYLDELPEAGRQSVTDSFKTAHPVFPLTEDTLAYFIYIGSGSNPAVAGDFNSWNPANGPMTHIAGTNFWYCSFIFERNARLDYKIVYNSNTWVLDPRNPYTAPGGFGNNSELRMPDYQVPEGLDYDAGIPHGSLTDTAFYSTFLGNSRKVKVYLPPSYAGSPQDYPLVLVNDGLEYLSFAKMNNVIDKGISLGTIRPLIAVFVPPVDRSPEYIEGKQEAFTNFISQELMPWLSQRFRVSADPSKRAVIGSSAGGNIALWLGLNHPEIFGNIGAFSPYIESDIINMFSTADKINLRIYMIHGSYDHIQEIHESVDAFLPLLEAKGYDYLFTEYPDSHSYGFWRAHTGDALQFFFPGEQVSSMEYEKNLIIESPIKNYPNPVTHTLYLNAPERLTKLSIFNVKGELARQVSHPTEAFIDVSMLTDGIYFVRAIYGENLQTFRFVKCNATLR